jgi:hypothetical protein
MGYSLRDLEFRARRLGVILKYFAGIFGFFGSFSGADFGVILVVIFVSFWGSL